jgi:glycosyltransferase involved in cell wall biosynthesis
MSIYLDGMFYCCTGVGRVYENLLTAFAGTGDVGGIHTIVPALHKDRFLEQFSHPMIVPTFVGYGPMGFGDLVLKSAALRSLRGKVRLYFFPGHNVPLFIKGRYTVTVHDVTAFSPFFRMAGYRKEGFRWLLTRAVRRAEKVVTVSEAAKKDIIREFAIPPGKVTVIYNWVTETFFSEEGPLCGASTAEGEYLLYVGLRIAHKNLDGLVQAFLLLAEDFPALKLVVAGRRYTMPDMIDRWKADPTLGGRLIEILDPTDETLRSLYAGAKAFVFPSYAEGFGLPPLEAMAAGVPVVCSDIPVFREVYGEAVRYVDPSRPESIAAGMREVLDDSGLSGSLRQRGRERASIYRQERSILKYLDLVRG